MKLPLIVAAIAGASISVSSQQPPANAGKFPTTADVFHPATFAARRAYLASLVADGRRLFGSMLQRIWALPVPTG